MKQIITLIAITFFVSCSNQINESSISTSEVEKSNPISQSELNNGKMKSYSFLDGMYHDSYFPNLLVDKVKSILIELCSEIEKVSPKDIDGLYHLTHEATNKINDLQDEFYKNESEIETVAREVIAMDFDFIAKAYGFEADIEELIATRDW